MTREAGRQKKTRSWSFGWKYFPYAVLKVHVPFSKAQWLSWLERRPVTAEVAGSSPAWVVQYGILAQLGEHLPYKQRVIGSSPIGPISYVKKYRLFGFIIRRCGSIGRAADL